MLTDPAAQPTPVAEASAPDFACALAEGQPVVLRNLVADWPAVRAGRESSRALATYLGALASDTPGEAWFGNPAIAGRFDFAESYTGLNHDRKLATVDQLLDLLLRQIDSAAPWSIYAGALPVARHLPEFLAANALPAILDPGTRMLISLWLGNATQTAAHWDLPHNLACVIGGRRRFTLFPPEQVKNLYVGPLDTTLAGQASSQADVERPDFKRFPRLRHAFAAARTVELEPGDALYVPSLWWHAVSAPDPLGAMVNFWWRQPGAGGGAQLGETPMMALSHALFTIRTLPAPERAAWRALFDHYVFGQDTESFAHIPIDKRGLLGDATIEQIRAAKDRLIQSLR